MTPLLFGKDTVNLEDVIASLISYEIRRKPNLEGGQDFGLVGQIENYK